MNNRFDYSKLKSAGVYTIEVDNTETPFVDVSALRMLVGFNPTYPFNSPILLKDEKERRLILGDINDVQEARGSFFNRSAQVMLTASPIFALNLMPIDEHDYSNYASLSLDTNAQNPSQSFTYSEPRDTTQENVRRKLKYVPTRKYRKEKGDFIGVAPYAELFERSRFWKPSKENLLKLSAIGSGSASTNIEDAPLISFANVSTKDVSLLVFKASGLIGYDITAREWYGGEESIPYAWIRPTDFMSDFFIQVVAIEGVWSDFESYSTDPYWSSYFTNRGLKYNSINDFFGANGVKVLGSWVGSIIPDFKDKNGSQEYIEAKINNSNQITGLMCAINHEALSSQYVEVEEREHIVEIQDGVYEEGVNKGLEKFIELDFQVTDINLMSDLSGKKVSKFVDLVGHNFKPTYNKPLNDKITMMSMSYDEKYNGSLISFAGNASYFGSPTTIVVPETTYKEGVSAEKVKALKDKLQVLNDGISVSDALEQMNQILEDIEDFFKTDENGTIVFNETALAKGQIPLLDSEGRATDGTYVYKLKTVLDKYINYAKYATRIPILTAFESLTDENTNVTAIKNRIGETIERIKAFATKKDTQGGKKGSDNSYKKYDAGIIEAIQNLSEIALAMTKNVDKVSTYGQILKGTLLHNVKKNENYLENNKDILKFLGGLTHLRSGVTRVTDVKVVSLETLLSMNRRNILSGNNTGLNLSEETINEYKRLASENKELKFKIITTPDPISIQKTTLNGESAELIEAYKQIAPLSLEQLQVVSDATSIEVNAFERWASSVDDKKWKSILDKFKILINTITADIIKSEVSTPVIEKVNEILAVSEVDDYITVQKPLTDPSVISDLKFIPLRGLTISAKHQPGFDKEGNRNYEAGVEKIYSMLYDEGIYRGLTNPDMIKYRYIIDSMGGGLKPEMGGKSYLSKLAKDRGKCTAILNAPSMKQFRNSTDPYFCDTFNTGASIQPSFNTKYIPQGGNQEMTNNGSFSLPSVDNGAKFCGVFSPWLNVSENGKVVSMPPSAYVSNAFIRKFNGGNQFGIVANNNGILSGRNLVGVEYQFDRTDRDYLEPFGINPIIKRDNQIKIYGNKTAFQTVKSDFGLLHVRENLNDIELEIEEILEKFVFEYGNPAIRSQIYSMINPLLFARKSAEVIHNYELSIDTSNNTNELVQESLGIVDTEIEFTKGQEKILNRVTVHKIGTL